MAAQVIQLVPAEETFSITWNLGTRCNYDCMYCPDIWHDNHSRHLDLDQLIKFWQDIYAKTQHYNLKYKISFTGGEPTVNRQFFPFVSWIKTNYGQHINKILITTNGSASYNYYHKLLKLVDNVSFSVHSEHIDEQKFFATVIKLHKNIDGTKFIHVNIMNEFWNQERIAQYIQLLDQHGISYTVNEINYQYQTRAVPVFKGNLNLAI